MSAWISVKERLPETDGETLVSNGLAVQVDDYIKGAGWSDEYFDVTHWQPLPEPPESGE